VADAWESKGGNWHTMNTFRKEGPAGIDGKYLTAAAAWIAEAPLAAEKANI